MAKISDLSGDERAQRIAELKKKMQQSAKRVQSEGAADADSAPTDAAPVAAAKHAAADNAVAESASARAPVAEMVETTADAAVGAADPASEADAAATAPVAQTAAPAINGNGAASSATVLVPEKSPEEKAKAEMNRREFLTYAWGASMGLLALGGGVVTFQFMYPRFKAGEFGGKFFSDGFYGSELPPEDAAPVSISDGKFWWVNDSGEPKAIYMVCTHLGCLYKWVGERNRFECPCHGSKFTREGLYIEGPAPRSLDLFETAQEEGEWVVDTGAKILGAPATESPAAGTA